MKKMLGRLFIFLGAILSIYGGGRAYFYFTGGFNLKNISSEFSFQPQWEIEHALSPEERVELKLALDQPFRYMAKGCQSYVFMSEDQNYVIKFFKYQRYRLQPWLKYFPSLPAIEKYRQQKIEKKWNKLDGFVKSWKMAFDHLKEESGLLFVHLNKTSDLKQILTIYDKLGIKHQLDLDQIEFCVQKRVQPLEDALMEHRTRGDLAGAKQLVQRLLDMTLSEYARGIIDNDHALMQNTGVANGQPIHIDVGQFVFNKAVQQPDVLRQELFTKMYRFKKWLREFYPEVYLFLDEKLAELIGPEYEVMQPKWRENSRKTHFNF